ncbi:hypothetical protein ABT063_07305 [Streptomyces sp. NPDC002838]|uniref:hypothetical protein n=1 Tax=Streptomyces sp. NPDC002838 TaxID=3154436 RepID=UPI00331A7B9B
MRLPFMRLPKPVSVCAPSSLCLAAAAALLSSPAQADPRPSCATTDDRAFPVTTRIHGGPDSYEAGGGYGTWYLDLTNTTTRTCGNIHPVVVLVDKRRTLEPAQPRLEFYDGTAGARPHSVRFERTDADELVGAFTDDRDRFSGFTVGPGKTLTVKVRMELTSDAEPNKVTVNAAVVQRHDGDGDWVGQSNDYRFDIEAEPTPRPEHEREPAPDPTASATAPAPDGRLSLAEELAGTGLGPTVALAAAALLLVASGALLLVRRRR